MKPFFLPISCKYDEVTRKAPDFGGYYDWKCPNRSEARYICENLLKRGKHDEMLGKYWLYDDEYVWFYTMYSGSYRTYDIREYYNKNDTCKICLVRKFKDE